MKWRRDGGLGGSAAGGALRRRALDDGGIAGVVVGVVAAVALVAFCLYPIIVGRLRRRQRSSSDKLDVEPGVVHGPNDPTNNDEHQRRLSSQDSFKSVEHIARGGLDASSSKELKWQSREHIPRSTAGEHGLHDRNLHVETGASDPMLWDNQASEYPSAHEEFMPREIGDAHNGVLNGTSADYYSPSIPSEAFGMVTTEEPFTDPRRSSSRGSSLRLTMKNIFNRKSTRDQTGSSPSSTIRGDVSGPSQDHDVPLQQITADRQTDSPVEMSSQSSDMPPPPAPKLGSPALIAPSSTPPLSTSDKSPSQSPPPENKFQTSPSPPTHPAPGTVNPMDIMPATTDTEMWHRTEHQLYVSYNQKSPSATPLPEPPPAEDQQVSSTQPVVQAQPATTMHSRTPSQVEPVLKQEPDEEEGDVVMGDIPSLDHLSPMPDLNARHPSYPSDESTPLPGATSTNPSTLNTPATQLDSPSPKLERQSGYGQSASPYSNPNASPRTGLFRCEEPGCNQSFDQPHKLK